MIATILPSSTTFHAVDYNERKVSEGVAELLEMKNFGSIGKIDPYTPDELKQYLIDYTQRNEYIKKPQFHLAISCRGDEYTQEQRASEAVKKAQVQNLHYELHLGEIFGSDIDVAIKTYIIDIQCICFAKKEGW